MPPARFLFHVWLSVFEAIARALTGQRRNRAWPLFFEIIVGAMRRNFLFGAAVSVPEARAFNEALAAGVPSKLAVERTRTTVGGVPVVRVVPRGARAPRRRVLYLHGGSYLMGSAATHAELIGRLALAGFEVFAIEYRLAPEHTVADAVTDVRTVWEACLAEGWPPGALAFAGDSAGGGLAYLVAIALRDAGRPLPAGIATIAPWADLSCPGASMEENERTDWGTASALRAQGVLAAGGRRLDDPSLSPAFANLEGLPASLVHVGEAELVRDAVKAFAAKLEAARVPTELVAWPHMVHDFHLFAQQLPLAAEATEAFGAWLRSKTTERSA